MNDVFLYAAASFGAVVILTFLWNLWLAPYRMLNERLDQAIADNQLPNEVPSEVPNEVPK